jgi:uncharacterized caspase-like protein
MILRFGAARSPNVAAVAAGASVRELEQGRIAMRLLILALSIAGILMTANSAKADRRVAFVVGNGAYKNVAQLSNPPISAKAMTKLLRTVGFEVIEGTDLSHDKLTKRLLEFGRKAQGADLALFYYSGQAIAINGTEYLLPIDADVKSEMNVKLGGAINVDLTLDQTMSEAKAKLVFLDISRNNPFPAMAPSATKTSHSVSVKTPLVEKKPVDNTLIAYATGPGEVAPDGPTGTVRPFTRALIANIAASGVEIQDAMTKVRAQVNQETNGRQNSWGHSSNLDGTTYLNPAAPPASGLAPAK